MTARPQTPRRRHCAPDANFTIAVSLPDANERSTCGGCSDGGVSTFLANDDGDDEDDDADDDDDDDDDDGGVAAAEVVAVTFRS